MPPRSGAPPPRGGPCPRQRGVGNIVGRNCPAARPGCRNSDDVSSLGTRTDRAARRVGVRAVWRRRGCCGCRSTGGDGVRLVGRERAMRPGDRRGGCPDRRRRARSHSSSKEPSQHDDDRHAAAAARRVRPSEGFSTVSQRRSRTVTRASVQQFASRRLYPAPPAVDALVT